MTDRRAYRRAYRAAHKNEIAAYARAYKQSEKGKARTRAYAQSEKGRATARAWRNSEKWRAVRRSHAGSPRPNKGRRTMRKLTRRFARWIAWKFAPDLECSGCLDLVTDAPWIVAGGRVYHNVECFVYACEEAPLVRAARHAGAA
jgi:hypothetical protein